MLNKIFEESTPNFSSRANEDITAIVLHTTAGSLPGSENWIKNPESQSSYHYIISKAGRITQYVRIAEAAWHAGRINRPSEVAKRIMKKTWWGGWVNPNRYTIGVAFEAITNEPLTESQVRAGADLLANLCDTYNIEKNNLFVLIHQDIAADKIDLHPWQTILLDRMVPKSAVPAGIQTYKINGPTANPAVYARLGTLLIPFATTWQDYVNAFGENTSIINITPGEMARENLKVSDLKIVKAQ